MRKLFRVMKALGMLANPRVWGSYVRTAESTRFDSDFRVSWSQSGEDLALEELLGSQSKGRYLDIGAHHPSRFSVTRKLHEQGWTGVNVDANAALVDLFRVARPRDVNICAAVGSEREYDFAVFEESAISTVSRSWEEDYLASGHRIARHEHVNGVTLRSLLDEYFVACGPDLLTIDIEGADLDALASADFARLPRERWPDWLLLESFPPVQEALTTASVQFATELGFIPTLVLPRATLLRKPQ